ncbi:MAG: CopG family transcriptional regulator [Xenococcaceae cyanobacterium]
MSTVSIGARIPPHLHEKLAQKAAKTDTSKSEVIISALAHYLECTEDMPLSQRMAEFEKRLAALEAKQSGE